MDRAIILGASRGLGAELAKKSCASGFSTVGISRKEEPLRALRGQFPLFDYHLADLSKSEEQERVVGLVMETPFSKLFCVAGGGPFGPYGEHQWKDHQWAWEVSFLAHARLLHAMAKARRFEQVVLVGSSVAEDSGDFGAASYAAAKHALRGLYQSLRLDYPQWDVRLCSPGYMDTPLLPLRAEVRDRGVHSPAHVAGEIWLWAGTTDIGGHKVYPKHPV